MWTRLATILRHNISKLLLVLAIVAFLLYGWPTMYRYDKIGERLVRTNRVTGETELLKYDGWHKMQQPEPKWTPWQGSKR